MLFLLPKFTLCYQSRANLCYLKDYQARQGKVLPAEKLFPIRRQIDKFSSLLPQQQWQQQQQQFKKLEAQCSRLKRIASYFNAWIECLCCMRGEYKWYLMQKNTGFFRTLYCCKVLYSPTITLSNVLTYRDGHKFPIDINSQISLNVCTLAKKNFWMKYWYECSL